MYNSWVPIIIIKEFICGSLIFLTKLENQKLCCAMSLSYNQKTTPVAESFFLEYRTLPLEVVCICPRLTHRKKWLHRLELSDNLNVVNGYTKNSYSETTTARIDTYWQLKLWICKDICTCYQYFRAPEAQIWRIVDEDMSILRKNNFLLLPVNHNTGNPLEMNKHYGIEGKHEKQNECPAWS